MGRHIKHTKVSKEQINFICEAYKKGYSSSELSKIVGISQPYVHILLNLNGVPAKNKHMSELGKKSWENRKLNETKRKNLEKIDRALAATKEYLNKLDNAEEVPDNFRLVYIATGENKKQLAKNLINKALELLEE